ncbi:DUF4309 domain-containing protein [Thermoflavimicrobium dichotomicum]|uniref:DUF4309 domain-containing protein n=1 Tax=Thermoflavimicrobium dichotomicum TaxID=46223 RepID=UPI0015878810|nr:DUF4309 domain-containing protein [Thermoflavimicrobium dichotomicum]
MNSINKWMIISVILLLIVIGLGAIHLVGTSEPVVKKKQLPVKDPQSPIELAQEIKKLAEKGHVYGIPPISIGTPKQKVIEKLGPSEGNLYKAKNVLFRYDSKNRICSITYEHRYGDDYIMIPKRYKKVLMADIKQVLGEPTYTEGNMYVEHYYQLNNYYVTFTTGGLEDQSGLLALRVSSKECESFGKGL